MKYAVLVAGGTGGHINAAIAIGEVLEDEGWNVHFITGQRPLDYKLFKNYSTSYLATKPLRTKNPLILFSNLIMNIFSFFFIFTKFLWKRPKFIIGAGGYVCGPVLLAGFLQFIPVFIIEQNAVMGLTNKILGWFSKKIFVHFTKTLGLSSYLSKKVVVVGNPTRKNIRPVPARNFDGELKVLVFGGSLGAKQINEIIWELIKSPVTYPISIHHQVGEDYKIESSQENLKYISMKYIEDIQQEYEWCNVIIARAGASTISELAIIKKPVLLIPYPAATDNHQFHNARIFQAESDFSVEVLEPQIKHPDAIEAVKSFLSKAFKQELNYSKSPSKENQTCNNIIKEIKNYARFT